MVRGDDSSSIHRRARRRRPRSATPAGTTTVFATEHQAPAAPNRLRACCRTWTSEHRLLGGTVVRTAWHQPTCPDGAAR
ncbi:hypothetical protein OHV05_34730 [Kitasatospora sp. NBC_00070]|uniref:hypothetical protein n=1 Tax=Kitasatospora sp. NBC_00070 TaxID=2975962 RepID=UPI00324D81C2